jgi:hypothetical protein
VATPGRLIDLIQVPVIKNDTLPYCMFSPLLFFVLYVRFFVSYPHIFSMIRILTPKIYPNAPRISFILYRYLCAAEIVR